MDHARGVGGAPAIYTVLHRAHSHSARGRVWWIARGCTTEEKCDMLLVAGARVYKILEYATANNAYVLHVVALRT